MNVNYTQIQAAAAFLFGTGITTPRGVAKLQLVKFKDPNAADPVIPPGRSPFEISAETWLKDHTTDSRGDESQPGLVVFCVMLIPPENSRAGKSDESPWLDPVDASFSGLVDWAANQMVPGP
jgi:hypothetical protein